MSGRLDKVRRLLARRPTATELAAARNVLAALVAHGDLDASDVRRAQDGIRVIEDAVWRRQEKPQ